MPEEYCDPIRPLCEEEDCFNPNSCDSRKNYWKQHNQTIYEIFKGLGNHVIRQQMKNSQEGFKDLIKIREKSGQI